MLLWRLQDSEGRSQTVETVLLVPALSVSSSHRVDLEPSRLWCGLGSGDVAVVDQRGRREACLQLHRQIVTCLALLGETVWSASFDGSICVVDSKSRKILCRLHDHTDAITTLTLDKNLVWTTSLNGEIISWDPISRTRVGEVFRLKSPRSSRPLRIYSVLVVNNTFWIGTGASIVVFDPETKQIRGRLPALTGIAEAHESRPHSPRSGVVSHAAATVEPQPAKVPRHNLPPLTIANSAFGSAHPDHRRRVTISGGAPPPAHIFEPPTTAFSPITVTSATTARTHSGAATTINSAGLIQAPATAASASGASVSTPTTTTTATTTTTTTTSSSSANTSPRRRAGSSADEHGAPLLIGFPDATVGPHDASTFVQRMKLLNRSQHKVVPVTTVTPSTPLESPAAQSSPASAASFVRSPPSTDGGHVVRGFEVYNRGSPQIPEPGGQSLAPHPAHPADIRSPDTLSLSDSTRPASTTLLPLFPPTPSRQTVDSPVSFPASGTATMSNSPHLHPAPPLLPLPFQEPANTEAPVFWPFHAGGAATQAAPTGSVLAAAVTGAPLSATSTGGSSAGTATTTTPSSTPAPPPLPSNSILTAAAHCLRWGKPYEVWSCSETSGRVQVWHTERMALLYEFQLQCAGIISLTSVGDYMVAAGYDGNVYFWHADSHVPLLELTAHTDAVRGLLAIGPRHFITTSGGRDGSVAVWCTPGEGHEAMPVVPGADARRRGDSLKSPSKSSSSASSGASSTPRPPVRAYDPLGFECIVPGVNDTATQELAFSAVPEPELSQIRTWRAQLAQQVTAWQRFWTNGAFERFVPAAVGGVDGGSGGGGPFATTPTASHDPTPTPSHRTHSPHAKALVPGKDEQLLSLISKGVALPHRPQLWTMLIHRWLDLAPQREPAYAARRTFYQQLAWRVRLHRVHQVELDLHRTYPTNRFFNTPSSRGYQVLRKVLVAFSHHSGATGYCQGFNFLAGFGLLFLPEDITFWFLVTVVNHIMPAGYYMDPMIEPRADQRVMLDLVERHLPDVWHALGHHEVDLSLVSFQWFFTLFVDCVPIEVTLAVWDRVLLEGRIALFRFSLAILKQYETLIVTANNKLSLFEIVRGLRSARYDMVALLQTVEALEIDEKAVQDRFSFHCEEIEAEERLYAIEADKIRQARANKEKKLTAALEQATAQAAAGTGGGGGDGGGRGGVEAAVAVSNPTAVTPSAAQPSALLGKCVPVPVLGVEEAAEANGVSITTATTDDADDNKLAALTPPLIGTGTGNNSVQDSPLVLHETSHITSSNNSTSMMLMSFAGDGGGGGASLPTSAQAMIMSPRSVASSSEDTVSSGSLRAGALAAPLAVPGTAARRRRLLSSVDGRAGPLVPFSYGGPNAVDLIAQLLAERELPGSPHTHAEGFGLPKTVLGENGGVLLPPPPPPPPQEDKDGVEKRLAGKGNGDDFSVFGSVVLAGGMAGDDAEDLRRRHSSSGKASLKSFVPEEDDADGLLVEDIMSVKTELTVVAAAPAASSYGAVR